MNIKNKKILILGDSITQGVGASCIDKCFVNQLAKISNAIVVNYGISGTRLARQIKPTILNPTFDKYFSSRINDMDKEADLVLLFGGTNDFGHGDAPYGEFGDKTVDTYCGAVYVTINELVKKYGKEKLIVLTPLHRATEDNSLNSYGIPVKNHLKEYVRIINETAKLFNVLVLDLYNEETNKYDFFDNYLGDGLHPNDDGHLWLANRIYKYLQEL